MIHKQLDEQTQAFIHEDKIQIRQENGEATTMWLTLTHEQVRELLLPTGIYMRVCRDGRWQSLLIEELTDKELEGPLSGRTQPELIAWVKSLVHWIRGGTV